MKRNIYALFFLGLLFSFDFLTAQLAFDESQVVVDNSQSAIGVSDVEMADFDGDGLSDILISAQNGNKVSLIRNLGGGEMGELELIDALQDPFFVENSDFDADGDQDFVSGDFNAGEVFLFTNDGTGLFTKTLITDLINSPYNARFADMDGDGDQDLLLVDYDEGVSLFVNDGGFTTPGIYIGGYYNTRDVVAADFDNDGDADLAMTNAFADEIYWVENLGANTFGLVMLAASGLDQALGINADDVNDDGFIDIIAGGYYDDNIVWFKNLGIGYFAPQAVLVSGLNAVREIEVVDHNQDGINDIIGIGSNEMVILTKDAPMLYTPTSITGYSNGYATETGDLDEDGINDIAYADYSKNEVGWFKGQGSGAYGSKNIITSVLDGPREHRYIDLDGDGDLDVVGVATLSNEVYWIERLDDGSFGKRNFMASLDGAVSIAIGDINGDGLPEIFAGSVYDDKIGYFANLGSKFSKFRLINQNSQNNPYSLELADFDGDGDLDLAAISFAYDDVCWFENLGAGNWGAKQIIEGNLNGAFDVKALDADGDGDQDLIAAAQYDNGIYYYENDGTGVFAPEVLIQSLPGARRLHLADMDNDGDQDVIASSFTADKIIWIESTAGGFGAVTEISPAAADGSYFIHAADLDFNGKMDVVSANFSDDEIGVYLQNEDGTFQSEQSISFGFSADPLHIDLADANGDGRIDFLVSKYNEEEVVEIYNTSCLPPQNLMTNLALLPSKVRLEWDDLQAVQYQIRLQEVGTTFAAQTFSSENFLKINTVSLTAGSTYEWDVRAQCDASGTGSDFSTPQQFTLPLLRTGAEVLSLYPNPAVDFVILPEAQSGTASIFSTGGTLVKVISLNDTQKLDVSDLPGGIYTVEMHLSTGVQTAKFIK